MSPNTRLGRFRATHDVPCCILKLLQRSGISPHHGNQAPALEKGTCECQCCEDACYKKPHSLASAQQTAPHQQLLIKSWGTNTVALLSASPILMDSAHSSPLSLAVDMQGTARHPQCNRRNSYKTSSSELAVHVQKTNGGFSFFLSRRLLPGTHTSKRPI